MTLTIEFIEKHFREKLWYLSNRFTSKGHDPLDLYHDLLVAISQQSFMSRRTTCRVTGQVLPVHPSHVHRFMLSRCIDIRRKRNRMTSRFRDINDYIHVLCARPQARDVDDLLEHLQNQLTSLAFQIVHMKVHPTPALHAAAERDRLLALQDSRKGKLRMNLHVATVLNRHISVEVGVGAATVSRAIDAAAVVLKPLML